MQTRSLGTLLLLLNVCVMHGQDRISFGVKGGFNYASQKFDYRDISDSRKAYRPGIKIGAFVHTPLSGRVAFAPALLYNQKGFREKVEFTNQYGNIIRREDTGVKLNYISADLPIRIENHTQRTTSYLLVGPRIDILLGYKDREVAATYKLYQNIYDQAEQITIGLVTAIGVEFNSNEEAGYFIEFEYNPDLTKVYRQPALSISSTLLALNVGMRIKRIK